MASLKASEIDAFIRKPSERVSLVLVYGPDDGLVAERATAIVKATTGKVDDPFSLTRLDGAEVASDPARLVDEAGTVSLFGSRRVVWVRDCGARNILPAVQPLLDTPFPSSLVVLEAGDLKKGTGVRKKVEDHPTAVAIACYADSAEDIARLIDRELKEAGLTIDRDARELLESHLGGDRLASRGELRKLCLYAMGRQSVTLADVVAIVGDASAFALDELFDAAAGGDVATADRVLGRLEASGTPASVAGTMLIRHFQLLERIRAEITAGRAAADVVAGIQPPIFFRRRPAVLRQISLWSADRIARALALLDEAMWRSRQMPHLSDAVIGNAVLLLARVAQNAGRR
jgi:DNA polymerase III subunit delta